MFLLRFKNKKSQIRRFYLDLGSLHEMSYVVAMMREDKERMISIKMFVERGIVSGRFKHR